MSSPAAPAPVGDRVTVVPADEHLLGLQKDPPVRHIPTQIFSDDYEKVFPPDEYGEELSPNARVWRAYEQEALTYDTAMIRQSRDGLDVMLVFAGLFSAVVTSFLVQVSQNLRPDSGGMTAILLHDLVVLQIQAGDASAPNITVPSADPFTSKGDPTALDLWMNALWAVSLAASLIVALSAVLVKQWLHRYIVLPSGTPSLRSHIRHFRFVGFEEWHVEAIIGTLPVIMHLSLGLFFVGLILFFIPLCLPLACALAAITFFVVGLYITSNILPLFYPQCPYSTPLTDFFPYLIHVTLAGGRILVQSTIVQRTTSVVTDVSLKSRAVVQRRLSALIRPASRTPMNHSTAVSPVIDTRKDRAEDLYSIRSNMLVTTRKREDRAVKRAYDQISVDALHWVFHVTANPTLHAVVFQSLGALPWDILEYAHAKWDDDMEMKASRDIMLERFSIWQDQYRPGDEADKERLCRSLVALPRGRPVESEVLHFPRLGESSESSGRLQAALLLPYLPEAISSLSNLRLFLDLAVEPIFLQMQDRPLHINVWRTLVPETLTRMFKHRVASVSDETWPMILHIMVLNPDLAWSWSTSYTSTQISPPKHSHVMTLAQALRDSPLRAVVFDLLLTAGPFTIYRPESGHDLSSETEVLICMWRLAVHVLSGYPTVPHRQLLYYVMTSLHHPDAGQHLNQVLSDIPLLSRLIQSVVRLAFPPQGSHATATLDDYCVHQLMTQYHEIATYDETFPFPSFQCIVHDHMRYMLIGTGTAEREGRSADQIMDLMTVALARGRNEAYQVFMEYDWPKIVYELHTLEAWRGSHKPKDVLHAFIRGVPFCLDEETRAAYIAFLFEPRKIVLLSVMTSMGAAFTSDFDLLYDLDPKHACWVEVLSTLRALHAWHEQYHKHTADDILPLYPLDNLTGLGEKCLKDSDHSVSTSLDDTVRQQLQEPSSNLDSGILRRLEYILESPPMEGIVVFWPE